MNWKPWAKWDEAKKKANWKSLLLFFGLTLALVALDFISKWIVQLNCDLYRQYEVIPNFFYITKSYNIAVAFSLGNQLGVAGRFINIAVSVIMSIVIAGYWILNNHKFNTFKRILASLLLAGALGNLIDRAFYWEGIVGFNGVIDFFQFYLGGGPSKEVGFLNPFATFNVADSYLTVGVAIIIVMMIVDSIKNKDGDDLTKDPRLEEKETPKEEKTDE